MYDYRLKRCLKLLDLKYSCYRTDAKVLAKKLVISKRTVCRDRKLIDSATDKNNPRLKRCAKLLELEYSAYHADVDALAKKLAVDKRTIFRELELIEEAIGRPLTLVRRRRKRRKT